MSEGITLEKKEEILTRLCSLPQHQENLLFSFLASLSYIKEQSPAKEQFVHEVYNNVIMCWTKEQER